MKHTKFIAIDPITGEHADEGALREAKNAFMATARKIVENARNHVPCKHLEHRLNPESQDDWNAVDNLMGELLNLLVESFGEVSLDFGMLMAKADEVGLIPGNSVGAHLSIARITTCQVLMGILTAHLSLVRDYGRNKTALEHYDTILDSLETSMEETLRGTAKADSGCKH